MRIRHGLSRATFTAIARPAVWLAFWLGGCAHAATISLDEALAAARRNADVAIAGHVASAAQADIVAADHAPLPTLSGKVYEIDLQHGIGPGSALGSKRIDKSVGLDWTWERGGKRALRTEAARRAAGAAQADVDEVRTQQLLATNAAFFDLLATQGRIEQLQAIERASRETADAIGRRQRAGDLAVQDAVRASIEAERARADADVAMLDMQRAQLVLAQLIGIGGAEAGALVARADWPAAVPAGAADAAADAAGAAAAGPGGTAAAGRAGRATAEQTGTEPRTPAVTSATAPATAPAIPQAIEQSLDQRADLRAAAGRLQAAQAALEGAAAQRKGDVTLGASFDHYPGTSTRQLEVRASIPLTWGYRYEGEIGRAQAQLDQARAQLDKTRRLALLELQRLQSELTAAAQRAARYDTQIVPRARDVADRAELAYGKGAMPLTDLLDARRTLRAVLLDALAARTELAKASGAWRLRTTP